MQCRVRSGITPQARSRFARWALHTARRRATWVARRQVCSLVIVVLGSVQHAHTRASLPPCLAMCDDPAVPAARLSAARHSCVTHQTRGLLRRGPPASGAHDRTPLHPSTTLLNMAAACIFCKIIKGASRAMSHLFCCKPLILTAAAGEIPSMKLFESDKTFAFLDINPLSKGHAVSKPSVRDRDQRVVDGFVSSSSSFPSITARSSQTFRMTLWPSSSR